MVVYRCLVLQIWEYLKDVTWEGQYVHTSVLKFISAIDTCDHRIDQSATATSVTPTSGPQQGCQNSHVTTGNTEHGGRECSDGEYVGKCVCVWGGGGGEGLHSGRIASIPVHGFHSFSIWRELQSCIIEI